MHRMYYYSPSRSENSNAPCPPIRKSSIKDWNYSHGNATSYDQHHSFNSQRQRSLSGSGSGSYSGCSSGSSSVTTTSSSSCSSANSRIHRQQSYKNRVNDDEKVKRSRAWANAYELSPDLYDKQLEMLAKKYGGHVKAQHAASVIQQAFRHYSMNKNFEKLRNYTGEKRLSRKLCDVGRSNTIWTEMIYDSNFRNEYHMQYSKKDKTSELKAYDESMNHALFNGTGSLDRASRGLLNKSYSLDYSSSKHHVFKSGKSSSHIVPKTIVTDLSSISPITNNGKIKPTRLPSLKCQLNSHSDPLIDKKLNDSNINNSPHESPSELTIDLPSVNFENLLESKETDILNDSFHSDSSDPAISPSILKHQMSDACFCSHNTNNINMTDDYEKNFDNLFANECASELEQVWQLSKSDSNSNNDDSDLIQSNNDDSLIKIYNNTEVKLRNKKKCSNLECKNYETPSSSNTNVKKLSPETSPIWKRKSALCSNPTLFDDAKRMSNISEVSEPESMDGRESQEGISSSASSDTASMGSDGCHHGYGKTSTMPSDSSSSTLNSKVSDRERKRCYRIGLTLFNKKPEKGIKYLIEKGFVEKKPFTVAKFLLSRKAISKQMIGEYLGNLQEPFNTECLERFTEQISFADLEIDEALRLFQSTFRMPGEAQKIERIIEAFSQHYCVCNAEYVKMFHNLDTVLLLSYAIIMLNTDLHNVNIKADRKMKLEDFIKNLRGIDDGSDIDLDLLLGIYNRIKTNEFKPASDHVTSVMKTESMIIGKKPQLALPHRRLVCYCRLFEVLDPNKKDKSHLHQREMFLFNDLLMVTKICPKKKNQADAFNFRQSFSLCGMVVHLFTTAYYAHGIKISTSSDGKTLIIFNARNEHDRSKFVEDLKESIMEMNEMENLRIEEELQKQKAHQNHHTFNRHSNDSGMVDIELLKSLDPGVNRLSAPECGVKKSNLTGSLIDLSEGAAARRGSGGSLDSGMASTSSGSTGSREDHLPLAQNEISQKTFKPQSSKSKFGIFGNKSKNTSRSSFKNFPNDSSEV